MKKLANEKINVNKLLMYAVFISIIIICFLPFYIMIINATHSNAALSSGVYVIPGNYFLKNYGYLMLRTNIWRGFLNSSLITVPATLISAYVCSLAGYGFSKFNFRWKNLLFWFILANLMIPREATLIGLYEFGKGIGLLDTLLIVMLTSMVMPHAVFWLRMYCDNGIPKSLMEAARIEGCGELAIFHHIIVPMIKPAIATISIFNFVQTWNNYIVPLVLINSKEKSPLPVMVALMNDMFETDLGAQYVGIAISIVPIIIIYSFLSKRILGGLKMGSVKG